MEALGTQEEEFKNASDEYLQYIIEGNIEEDDLFEIADSYLENMTSSQKPVAMRYTEGEEPIIFTVGQDDYKYMDEDIIFKKVESVYEEDKTDYGSYIIYNQKSGKIDYIDKIGDEIINLETKEKYEFKNSDVENSIKTRISDKEAEPIIVENRLDSKDSPLLNDDKTPKRIMFQFNTPICEKYHFNKEELTNLFVKNPTMNSSEYFKGLKAILTGAVTGINIEKGENDADAQKRLEDKVLDTKINIAKDVIQKGVLKLVVDLAQDKGILNYEKDNIFVEKTGITNPTDAVKDYAKGILLLERVKGLNVSSKIVLNDIKIDYYNNPDTETKKEYKDVKEKADVYAEALNNFMMNPFPTTEDFDDLYEKGEVLKDVISDRLEIIVDKHNNDKDFDNTEIIKAYKDFYKDDDVQKIIDGKETNEEILNLKVVTDTQRPTATEKDSSIKEVIANTKEVDNKDDLKLSIGTALENHFVEKFKDLPDTDERKIKVTEEILSNKHITITNGVCHDKMGTPITPMNDRTRTVDSKAIIIETLQKFGSYYAVADDGKGGGKIRDITIHTINSVVGKETSPWLGNIMTDLEGMQMKGIDEDEFNTKTGQLDIKEDNDTDDKFSKDKTDKTVKDEPNDAVHKTGEKEPNDTVKNEDKKEGFYTKDVHDNMDKVYYKQKEAPKEEKVERKSHNDTPVYDENGQPIAGGTRGSAKPVGIAIAGGVMLAFIANPLFGIMALIGAFAANKIYTDRQELIKEGKMYDRTVEKAEQPEKPSFKEQAKEFSDVIKGMKDDSFKEKVENATFNGINKDDFARAVKSDLVKDGVTTEKGDFYEKTAKERIIDQIKDDVGVKGESFKSAFGKISTLMEGWRTDKSYLDVNAATGGAVKGMNTENFKDKISLGSVVKSAFGLMAGITPAAIKADSIIRDRADTLYKGVTSDDIRKGINEGNKQEVFKEALSKHVSEQPGNNIEKEGDEGKAKQTPQPEGVEPTKEKKNQQDQHDPMAAAEDTNSSGSATKEKQAEKDSSVKDAEGKATDVQGQGDGADNVTTKEEVELRKDELDDSSPQNNSVTDGTPDGKASIDEASTDNPPEEDKQRGVDTPPADTTSNDNGETPILNDGISGAPENVPEDDKTPSEGPPTIADLFKGDDFSVNDVKEAFDSYKDRGDEGLSDFKNDIAAALSEMVNEGKIEPEAAKEAANDIIDIAFNANPEIGDDTRQEMKNDTLGDIYDGLKNAPEISRDDYIGVDDKTTADEITALRDEVNELKQIISDAIEKIPGYSPDPIIYEENVNEIDKAINNDLDYTVTGVENYEITDPIYEVPEATFATEDVAGDAAMKAAQDAAINNSNLQVDGQEVNNETSDDGTPVEKTSAEGIPTDDYQSDDIEKDNDD